MRLGEARGLVDKVKESMLRAPQPGHQPVASHIRSQGSVWNSPPKEGDGRGPGSSR